MFSVGDSYKFCQKFLILSLDSQILCYNKFYQILKLKILVWLKIKISEGLNGSEHSKINHML